MKFKESKLAHKYCTGHGIEIGAAAHNPFNLKSCINIAPKIDEKFYANSQIKLCGEQTKIDIYASADDIPLESNSKDYIISSHVVEHIPDLIGAFVEWDRILKQNGIVFIIFPKRTALPSDVGRPLSEISQFIAANLNKSNHGLVDIDNHIWVFSLDLMVELLEHCFIINKFNWKIIEKLETDDKVGNGHCIICKKN